MSCVSSLLRYLEAVVIGNVRNTNDEYAHPSTGTVNNIWRNVDESSLRNRLIDTVKDHTATTVENVIDFCGTLVKVEFDAVDIHSR